MKTWIFKGTDGYLHFHCGPRKLAHWIDAKQVEASGEEVQRWADAWAYFKGMQNEMQQAQQRPHCLEEQEWPA